ncbi:putative sugar efflux transporter [Actinokineospora fastidiosa]|uniref:Sugar efflux transporter n=1 Tax=Actinokineospora fastidiosa TaxID=1816 RepID=A0A918GLG9_9PSEU|nr:putative sugar efflux transporter [Actinokineospora fastidiosa]
MVLAVSAFVVVTTEMLPVGLMALISEDLDVTPANVGLLMTGYAFTVGLSASPLTAWTSRWPRRSLFLVVCAVFASGTVLAGLATSYPMLLAARLLCGAAHGVFFSIVNGYAAALAGPARAGRAVAVIVAGNLVAIVLGMPLGSALASVAGWRVAFAIVAAVCVAMLVAAFSILPAVPAQPTVRLVDLPRVARTPGLRSIVVVTALVCLAHFTVYTYATPLLHNAGMSSGATSGALLLYGLAGLASTWLVGVVADRRMRLCLFVAIGAHVSALVALALGAEVGLVTVVAFAALSAAFTALTIGLQAVLLTIADGHVDAASSLYVATFNIGIGGGAFIGGLVVDRAGVHSLPSVAILFVTAAAVVMWRIRDPRA